MCPTRLRPAKDKLISSLNSTLTHSFSPLHPDGYRTHSLLEEVDASVS